MTEFCGSRDVKIAARACDAQPRLICADDGRVTGRGFEPLFSADQFS